MHLKSTSNSTSEHFTVLKTSNLPLARKKNRRIPIQKSDSELFFHFTQSVRLTADQGLAMIVLTDSPDDPESYQEFVLTNSIDLSAGIYFNTLAMTEACTIYMEPLGKDKAQTVPTSKKIVARSYSPKLSIHTIHSVFYQVKMAPAESFAIAGDYYELIIVDQGSLSFNTPDGQVIAHKNDCFIYSPGQDRHHLIKEEGISSYLSILFDAQGLTPSITDRVIHLGSQNARQIEYLIEFSDISKRHTYSDDELYIHLKRILLTILQGDADLTPRPTTSMRENYESELFQAMVKFLEDHVEDLNQVNDLVEHFTLSRSTIQSLFNKYAQTTPKNYINSIRLNRSKEMIRDTKLTLSQIADQLGYGSIQYFSRAFSKEFGMSPSSFAKSIIK